MLQEFLESTQGQVFVVGIIVLFFGLIFYTGRKEKISSKALTYSAICIGIGYALNQITLFRMPQGGAITPFSMLFIVLVGYLFGAKQGILAGMAFGLLDLLINPYVIHPVQMILDYPFAFGALGIGALFGNRHIIFVYLIGVLGRFVCAVLSGVIFFASAAPKAQGALLYSIIYNGSYLSVEAILTCILLSIVPVRKAIESIKNNIKDEK